MRVLLPFEKEAAERRRQRRREHLRQLGITAVADDEDLTEFLESSDEEEEEEREETLHASASSPPSEYQVQVIEQRIEVATEQFQETQTDQEILKNSSFQKTNATTSSSEFASSIEHRLNTESHSELSNASAKSPPKEAFRSSPNKKRPRATTLLDSKPPAMAGGRRLPDDASDDPAAEPFENTPTSHDNNHHRATITICPSSKTNASPVDDDKAEYVDETNIQPPSPTDLAFRKALKTRGLEIRQQEGDGNCLFRAVSLQVYGDPSMHAEVRERCVDFMERDPEHFSPFVSEPFGTYIARKRRDGVHGNNAEIQAISELFNRPVEVFTPDQGATPLNIFQTAYKTQDAPIRLSYHDGNHYNAVIDPLVPTAGLGLGLPGLQPGLADKLQVAKAVAESDHMADELDLEKALKESEEEQVRQAIKESSASLGQMYQSKLMSQQLTDVDAANFDLEQKVLANSLETYRRQEQGRKRCASGPRSPPVEEEPARNFPVFASNPVAAAAASIEPAPSAVAAHAPPPALGPVDEYPATVQELVMNGFEIRKVVHAFELIGDSFDDLLAFLMSNT